MNSTRSNWLFSLLWINGAVAIMILVQVLMNQINNARDLRYATGYAMVYANLTGILALLIVGAFSSKAWAAKLPLPALLAFCIIVFVPIGCLLAQTLLMIMGLVVPRNFWLDYLHTLRVSLPLSAVFGLGASAHGVLRERVRASEEKLRLKEAAEERARKLATEARLRSLEARIHPHFLFNTLNSISSLISIDPPGAEQMVGRLATLLRSSLDNGNQTLIPLQQELTMVSSYLDIERARFGDKLRASTDVADELLSAKVPPMSVQALVENAVKHGIAPQRGGGAIVVAASAENGSLKIEVRDSGPGFNLTAIPAGHGLDNLVERLDALFGAAARLNVYRRDDQSIVEMVLPKV